MKRILALCLSAVAICGLALNGPTKSETSRSASSSAAQEAEELTDPALYTSLFRHLNHLQKRADSFRQLGKDGSKFQRRFQRTLVIDDDQFEQLNDIALQWESEATELDKKALRVIEAFRQQYPPGEVPEGVIVPPPPAELLALQEQRDQVTRSSVNRLRSILGAREFIRFDEIVRLQLRPQRLDAARP